MSQNFDVLIIGSGPAGLTASIYAARANQKVGIVIGPEQGGQLMNTTDVDNYPGFANGIMGPDLMDAMFQQAKNVGVEMIEGSLHKFDKIDGKFEVMLESGEVVSSNAMIVATGANAKWLGIEQSFIGRGVSSCATCDGAFFKNKTVAVIGGGNSAMEEALYLANIAARVILIHRRKNFRGEAMLQDRVKAQSKIEIKWPYQVIEFLGEKKLEKLYLENTETGEKELLAADGAFVAIGHRPNTSFLEGVLELRDGYVKDGPVTQIPGLFVAGDVFDDKYRQAITAAGYGCMAAIDALKYLEMNVSHGTV